MGESLIYFQRKVASIVEPIGLTLDDLYFVIHPFKFSGMNGVIAVVEDAILISFQHPDKGINRWVV